MTYSVWLQVQNDDDADSAPVKATWMVDEDEAEEGALQVAREIVAEFTRRTGRVPKEVEEGEDDW